MAGALRRLLILNDQRNFALMLGSVAERLRFATRIVPHVLDLEYIVQHWRPDIIAIQMAMPDNQDVEALEYLERNRFSSPLLLTGDVSQNALEKAATVARGHGLAVASVLTCHSPIEEIESALKRLLDLERAA